MLWQPRGRQMPLLTKPQCHRAKAPLVGNPSLHYSSRLAVLSKGCGPNPVTTAQNVIMRRLGLVANSEALSKGCGPNPVTT